MKALLAILPLLALSAARSQFNMELEPLSDAMIFYINNVANTTWRAGRNFPENDLARVEGMLGVDMEKMEYDIRSMKTKETDPVDVSNLPASFDPRTKWPKCASMKEIRDQGYCGSCWAFGSVEAMSDRICAKYGKNVHLSAADLVECCSTCFGINGCKGGSPPEAWDYYVNSGVVTGGQYNSSRGCMPYPIAESKNLNTIKRRPYNKIKRPAPKCQHKCESGYPKSYHQDKHFGKRAYRVKGIPQIMQELVENGPVTATILIYHDFYSYKSGVYQHKYPKPSSLHSVKILGYGTEGGVDYWLVANSWNVRWGDKGFIKIRRGIDECRIERYVLAGDPEE